MNEEELIYNETNECFRLAQLVEPGNVVVLQVSEDSCSVSLQNGQDSMTGRAINLTHTVSAPTRLGAWQAMRLQLESMLS